jgi:hypothetical protein
MTNSKITRRKTLLLILAGVSALAISVPTQAQKKKPSRNQNSDAFHPISSSIPDLIATLIATSTSPPTPAPAPKSAPNSAWIGSVVAAVCGGLGVLWVVFKEKDFRE